MKFSYSFYCLNPKVRPFEGFILDLSKIAMWEHVSIDPPPGFEHMVVQDHRMTRSLNFLWFWNSFDPNITIQGDFHLKFETKMKIRKKSIFSPKKGQNRKRVAAPPKMGQFSCPLESKTLGSICII